MVLHMNEAILLGNVGGDPEVRVLNNGGKRVRFRLATNRRWRDNNGEWVERTDWHTVVVFAPWAESASTMVRKGEQVMVRGRIEYWESQDPVSNETKRGVQLTVAGPHSLVNLLSPPPGDRRSVDTGPVAADPAPGDGGAGDAPPAGEAGTDPGTASGASPGAGSGGGDALPAGEQRSGELAV